MKKIIFGTLAVLLLTGAAVFAGSYCCSTEECPACCKTECCEGTGSCEIKK